MCIRDSFQTPYQFGSYLLYFGRLSYVKGVKTLLKAAKKNQHIPIKIAGTGPILKELKCYTEAHKIKNVSFVGFQKGNDLFELIAGARATIVPSEWFENFPLSVIESLAMGRPVIGANIGGIPEQVINRQTGFIFESGNTKQLLTAISKLWELPKEKHELLSQSCRAFALSAYNREDHYNKLVNLFYTVVSEAHKEKAILKPVV